MRRFPLIAAPVALLLLASCASDRFEASVTRFHLEPPALRSTVAVVPANPAQAGSLAFAADARAVASEFAAAGFPGAPEASAELLALLAVGSSTGEGAPRQSPVSIGIGGGTSSGNVGIGGGVSLPLGKPQSRLVTRTEMTLSLRRRTDNAVVWEGRASTSANGSPRPETAALLARALLSDFPGRSGETVRWVAR